MKVLQVGDRVAVYDRIRTFGIVEEICEERGDEFAVKVRNTRTEFTQWFHRGQLRRLVRRLPRKRVWIDLAKFKSVSLDLWNGKVLDTSPPEEPGDWVEFVEVRRTGERK